MDSQNGDWAERRAMDKADQNGSPGIKCCLLAEVMAGNVAYPWVSSLLSLPAVSGALWLAAQGDFQVQ